MKNANSNKIVIIIIGILVLGLGGYFVYDNVIKGNSQKNDNVENENSKDDNENSTNDGINSKEEDDTAKMDVTMKDNIVYVNGNKVDMYTLFNKPNSYRINYNNETEFYAHRDGGTDATLEYEIIDDIVFIDYSPANTLGMELMFADKNGKINYDASEKAGFGGIQFYNVEGKDIILEHGRYSLLESTVCDKVALGLGNEIAITYDKIRYLGNNEFDIEKKYKELTYNEVVSDTNKFNFVCE